MTPTARQWRILELLADPARVGQWWWANSFAPHDLGWLANGGLVERKRASREVRITAAGRHLVHERLFELRAAEGGGDANPSS